MWIFLNLMPKSQFWHWQQKKWENYRKHKCLEHLGGNNTFITVESIDYLIMKEGHQTDPKSAVQHMPKRVPFNPHNHTVMQTITWLHQVWVAVQHYYYNPLESWAWPHDREMEPGAGYRWTRCGSVFIPISISPIKLCNDRFFFFQTKRWEWVTAFDMDASRPSASAGWLWQNS